MEVQLKAQKMFEVLGFRMVQNNKDKMEYIDKNLELIVFYKNIKSVFKFDATTTMPILKAINQQCKELKWLDE